MSDPKPPRTSLSAACADRRLTLPRIPQPTWENRMSRFERHDADQSTTLRSDLKAKSKRRRDRLTALASASASPLRRRNDLIPRLSIEERAPAELVVPARHVRRSEAAHIREIRWLQ